MGYIPFNCLLFDRLIASFKSAGNVGFLMYLADSFGYLGSVGIVTIKQFGILQDMSWHLFYTQGILVMLSIGTGMMLFTLLYFKRKTKTYESGTVENISLASKI